MITTARTSPKFQPGQLIHHRRYHYRGVIVAVDVACQASDDWYESNQTQPSRNQPWYHVLVHDAGHTTYVAESNLEPDESGAPIAHPLVPYFFDDFSGGKYARNQQPWPGQE